MPNVFERNPKKTIWIVSVTLLWVVDFTLANIFPRYDSDLRIPHRLYHHDLSPNVETRLKWGKVTHPVSTNSLGFKDSVVRKVAPVSKTYRILFIGDSFTEGVGYPFEQTFVGQISRKLGGQVEVLNAGVSSYSPKLYYLKTKALLENESLKIDELVVFIDISDIQDEVVYAGFKPKVLFFADNREKILLDNSVILRLLDRLRVIGKIRKLLGLDTELPEGIDPTAFREEYYFGRGRWTFDAEVFRKWGGVGLDLAIQNMDALYKLSVENHFKLTLAVYPWPEQILNRDLNSKQVQVWQKFCEERGIQFQNLFPVFMDPAADRNQIVKEYYIEGDVHWNDQGHQLVADQWLQFRCGKQTPIGTQCFHR